ncbi:hypothetical protein ACFL6N_00875 [Thermodesulfobacteriota bacterium]
MKTELRGRQRYQVSPTVLALIRSHQDSNEVKFVYEIRDIHSQGVGLSYVGLELHPENDYYLDAVDSIIKIRRLPLEIRYDHGVSSDGNHSRQCGAKFGGLSENQMFHLNHFFNHFTEMANDSLSWPKRQKAG